MKNKGRGLCLSLSFFLLFLLVGCKGEDNEMALASMNEAYETTGENSKQKDVTEGMERTKEKEVKIELIESVGPIIPVELDEASCSGVNINTASVEELEEIIHIGQDRSEDVVANRPFSSVEELVNIDGIEPAHIADILTEGLACVEIEIHGKSED